MALRNGGGAFFIPFIAMIVLIGAPLFHLEATIGQFTSSGPLTCWEFAPIASGVGISLLIVCAFELIYYNVLICWCFHFLFASLQRELPWASCDHWWNTDSIML